MRQQRTLPIESPPHHPSPRRNKRRRQRRPPTTPIRTLPPTSAQPQAPPQHWMTGAPRTSLRAMGRYANQLTHVLYPLRVSCRTPENPWTHTFVATVNKQLQPGYNCCYQLCEYALHPFNCSFSYTWKYGHRGHDTNGKTSTLQVRALGATLGTLGKPQRSTPCNVPCNVPEHRNSTHSGMFTPHDRTQNEYKDLRTCAPTPNHDTLASGDDSFGPNDGPEHRRKPFLYTSNI